MNFESWQIWAVLSAVFAALTAIFAKIGVENINSDLATFIRTVVVLVSFVLLLFATGQFVSPGPDFGPNLDIPDSVGPWHRRVLAMLFPRPEARPGVAGRPGRQTQRGAGRDFRRAHFRRTAFSRLDGLASP